MGAEVIIAMLWKYRMVFLYAVIAGLLYWAFVHNPKVIKQLEGEKKAALEQVQAAYDAINLLQNIGRKHGEIERTYEESLRKIRSSRKPTRTGYFVLDGLLPEMFEAYTSSDRNTSTDD